MKDGGASIVDLRAVDADARRRAARPDRRVQPRGLHRDAAPPRLAARAARRGARAVRAVPAARAEGAEADPGAQGRARRAPRASCSTPGRSSRRSCSTTTTASASRSGGRSSTAIEMTPAELVEDAESIGRLELVGGPEPVERSHAYTLTFPPQEHKIGEGQNVDRPGDAARTPGEIIELDREARRLVLKRGPTLAGRAAARGADSRATRTDTNDQEDALERLGRSLLAGDRRYPALESILRREPFDRAVQTTDLDEMKELVLSLDGRHLVIQGPPGSGKTWTSGRLIAHSDRERQARRRRLDEPQGDPQPARRGRGRCRRARARLPRAEEGERRQPRVAVRRARAHRERHRQRRRAPTATLAAGTAWLFSRIRPRRHARLPLHRRGRAGLARRRARDGRRAARNVVLVGDPQQLEQVIQGTHPRGQRRVGAAAPARRRRDDPARPRPLPRAHVTACTRTSAPTSRRSSTRGGCGPTPVAATRTTPLGTGLRYLAVEHEGNRQESREEVDVVRAEVERLLAAGVSRP